MNNIKLPVKELIDLDDRNVTITYGYLDYDGHQVINIKRRYKDNSLLIDGYCITHDKFYYVLDGQPNYPFVTGLFSRLKPC